MRSILLALLLLPLEALASLQAPNLSQTVATNAKHALNCARKMGRKADTLLVADMSKSSREKRLWAFDVKDNPQLLLTSYVAHGRGSDPSNEGRPRHFSNVENSLATSLGLYQVAETYEGREGDTRWRLDGMMKGWNDQARKRAIVIHEADYVAWGGRSEGCPAIAPDVREQLESRGLSNAILWMDGNEPDLAIEIARCDKSTFRYFWPSPSPKKRKPIPLPTSHMAFNPHYFNPKPMCEFRTDTAFLDIITFACLPDGKNPVQ